MDGGEKGGRAGEGTEPGRRPPRRRHLPSLGSFATFEVAAKHLSFTGAAGELHVTQAAISQQIRGLEQALGCRLFLRKRGGMALTPEGRMLLEAVTRGLDSFSDAIQRIGRAGDRRSLTIAGTHAGMSQFLRPVAEAFQDANPEIRFTLLASDENDRLQDFEEVDLAIICGSERAEIGSDLIRLFPEVVDPVCAPAYAARFAAEWGAPAGPAALAGADLMELHRMHWSSDAISWRPLAWADWFRLHAPEAEAPEPRFVTNSYGALMAAAEEGRGVILGWRHLALQAMRAGRLVRLLEAPLNTGRWYFLRVNAGARDNPHAQAFIAQLRAEAEAPELQA